MTSVNVKYKGSLTQLSVDMTITAVAGALQESPSALFFLIPCSMDTPYAYPLPRIPGLKLEAEDSKFRYVRFMGYSERLSPALSRQNFPPHAIYALPASSELALLHARAAWEGRGAQAAGGMGVSLAGGSGAAGASAPAGPLFSHDALLKLAQLEQSARTSPEFQALFSAAERDEYNKYGVATWMELCSELQYSLVWLALCHRKKCRPEAAAALADFAPSPAALAEATLHTFNATPSAAVGASCAEGLSVGASLRDAVRGVHMLRLGGHTYPETIGQVSLYWKWNRVGRGSLRNGDAAPNAALHTLNGEPTDLHTIVAASHPRPVLVLAGSYS